MTRGRYVLRSCPRNSKHPAVWVRLCSMSLANTCKVVRVHPGLFPRTGKIQLFCPCGAATQPWRTLASIGRAKTILQTTALLLVLSKHVERVRREDDGAFETMTRGSILPHQPPRLLCFIHDRLTNRCAAVSSTVGDGPYGQVQCKSLSSPLR